MFSRPIAVTILLLLIFSYAGAQSPVIDSLQKIVLQGREDSTAAVVYIRLTDEYARINIAEAKKCALQAESLSRKLGLASTLSLAYSELTTLNVQTNQPDSARHYLEQLKELADKHPTVKIREDYNFTAGLYYRKQGNYKASLPYMLESLRLITQEGNKTGMAGQNLNIGNSYQSLGEYKNAMVYHLKALALFDSLGNRRGLSFCYNSIGNDYMSLNQFAQALPYIEKSLALKNELNDKKGKAVSYMSLGEIEASLDHPQKALSGYRESLALNRELKLTLEEAKVDFDMGKLYAKQRQGDSAREYFYRSRSLFRESRDTALVYAVDAELANLSNDVYGRQHTNAIKDDTAPRSNEAVPVLNEKASGGQVLVSENPRGQGSKAGEKVFLNTLNTSKAMGDKGTEISNYKYLSDYYAKNSQYDKALAYNEKYHSVLDSIENNELQLQLRTLEGQYNLEKKEKEIRLLKEEKLLYKANLRNQELFRYGALLLLVLLVIIGVLWAARNRVLQKARRLIEIEKLRNQIARNLHDDIGSTLTSINILSKVALQHANGNVSVTDDLEKIKERSSTIMESMGDIVWAINPANDTLDKTILKMKEFSAEILEPAGIGFTFREEGPLNGCRLGVAERKNVYLIFKEAINNMVKYSGATLADISLQRTDHRWLLKISDNGRGFDTEKPFCGSGLKNMQSRATEMNGIFTIDSSPDAGTRIYVTIPITS